MRWMIAIAVLTSSTVLSAHHSFGVVVLAGGQGRITGIPSTSRAESAANRSSSLPRRRTAMADQIRCKIRSFLRAHRPSST
jgi:hypothetical protein